MLTVLQNRNPVTLHTEKVDRSLALQTQQGKHMQEGKQLKYKSKTLLMGSINVRNKTSVPFRMQQVHYSKLLYYHHQVATDS